MRKKQSKIWGVAFALSLIFLASAYYLRVPAFRRFVDDKTPLAHKYLGPWLPDSDGRAERVEWQAEMIPAEVPVAPPSRPPVAADSSVLPVAPAPSPGEMAPELQKIAGDRARWPKTVKLTRAATFPAVSNGKIVGSLIAPAGTEVVLHAIRDDKVGLEFNGGGAWLPVDQTDLLVRALAPR